MKKDILAVLTFITTGFLFYLLQVGGPTENTLLANENAGVVVEAVIDQSEGEASGDLLKKEEGRRDS